MLGEYPASSRSRIHWSCHCRSVRVGGVRRLCGGSPGAVEDGGMDFGEVVSDFGLGASGGCVVFLSLVSVAAVVAAIAGDD